MVSTWKDGAGVRFAGLLLMRIHQVFEKKLLHIFLHVARVVEYHSSKSSGAFIRLL